MEKSFLLYFNNATQFYSGDSLIIFNFGRNIFEYNSPENTFTISSDIWDEFANKYKLTYIETKMFIENFLILLLNFKNNIDIQVGSIC